MAFDAELGVLIGPYLERLRTLLIEGCQSCELIEHRQNVSGRCHPSSLRTAGWRPPTGLWPGSLGCSGGQAKHPKRVTNWLWTMMLQLVFAVAGSRSGAEGRAQVMRRTGMAAQTLAQALEFAMVDPKQLERDYKPLIQIVRELVGVVPNCNPVLEIWPPGFRTFNVLVPNLLNLPPALMGQGAPKDLVGLAMYNSSREAGCMYCTAHHCSYAIRRGNSIETVVEENYTPVQAAVADVARSIAASPPRLTKAKVDALAEFLSPSDIEWVVLAVALSGFLNKFMDGMGIELENDTIHDVAPLISDQGWSPGKHQWLEELPEREANGEIPTDNYRTILRVYARPRVRSGTTPARPRVCRAGSARR